VAAPARDTTDPLFTAEPTPRDTVRLGRARAFAVLVCVVCGTLLARILPPPILVDRLELIFLAASVLGVLAMVWRGRAAAPLLAVGVVLLSTAWTSARLHTVPNDSLLLGVPVTEASIPVRVRGVLTARPEVSPPTEDPFAPIRLGHTRLGLRLTAAMTGEGDRRAWEPVSGKVVAHAPIDASLDGLEPGDSLEVRGMLRTPSSRLNPGEPDWLSLARQRGSAGFLRVADASLIEPAPPPTRWRDSFAAWRVRALGSMRARAASGIGLGQGDEPDETREAGGARSLLAALLLGVRSDPNEPLPTAMRRLGLAHLMAISGFHLALAAGFALLALRAFRDLGRAEPLILAALVLLYVAVLPVRTPVLRAALMVLGLLAASGLGRRYDARGVLCWIAVGLLVWRPLDATSLGFQLSLGITALLLSTGGTGGAGLHRPAMDQARAAARWPVRAGRACVACWAVGQPTVLAHFGTLSPLGWLATLIVVLPISALLGIGYVALAVGAVWPGGGRAIMGALEVPARWVVDLVAFMDGVPGAWFQLPLLPVWLAALLTLAVLGVVLRRPGLRGEHRRWPRWAALAAVLALMIPVLNRQSSTGRGVLVRVDTIAVGSGSCHVVRSGSAAVLIDAGSMTAGAGRELLPGVLRELGVVRVPVAIVTHPNLDHYNALPDLAGPLGLARVYLTEEFFRAAQTFGPEARFVRAMETAGVSLLPIAAGDSLTIGSARLDVLWPPAGLDSVSANDTSVMALLHATSSRGDRTVLFTGDAGEIPLSTILAHPAFPVVHAIELPHHGSYNVVSEAIVRELSPLVVLQSTGPTRVGDARWDGARIGRVWRTTAVDGCVTTTLHTDGHLEIRSER
jgi:competence protein ComEC